MAGLNDFKLVNIYSTELLRRKLNNKQYSELSDSNKKRYGFYYLILQLTTGETELEELEKMIIDTDYYKSIYKVKNNDYGIDAVYVDYESNRILLYNFKFREKYDAKIGGKQGPILDSTKFLSMTLNNSFKDINDVDLISKEKMEEISNKVNSDEIWNIQ